MNSSIVIFWREYHDIIPAEFLADPQGYIEEQWENIKSGDIQFDEAWNISEDPTASKFLPEWSRPGEAPLELVSKRINLKKLFTKTATEQRRYVDPLLEYRLMLLCQTIGLPSAKPVGLVTGTDYRYVIMERISGMTWTKRDLGSLQERDISLTRDVLRSEIQELLQDLELRFQKYGIHAQWKYEDMIFRLDETRSHVSEIIPVDWEWSYVNTPKLLENTQSFSVEQRDKIRRILEMTEKDVV